MQLPNNSSLKKGKYQIVRSLGQGGYGITYLAITTEEMKGDLGTFPMSVPVAIKEFFVKTYCTREDLTYDVVVHTEEGKALVPQLKKDFIREANSISKMKHPNIVRVIDIFEEHQTVYYVMQYLEGGSLSDKVNNNGPLESNTAKKIIFQIGKAVSYLHEHKVCHYDLKPANIMLPNDDKAVLIDFGISRHYDEQGNSTTVRPVGYSSGFSSPEQIIGDTQKFSPASDIYSLAAILYYMLTGKIPTDGIDKCPPSVPQEIWNAIEAGMNADINKRPQTVTEWLAYIDDSTKKRPEKKVVLPTPSLPSKPTINWKKLLIVSLCISLVIVGIVSGVLLLSKKDHDKTVKNVSEVNNMQCNNKNRYGNTFTYSGTIVDSIPNGQGRAIFSDGSSYEGIFRNGLRDDQNAKYIDQNGNIFSGTFKNDTIVQGRITAPDGRYYEGKFSNDQPYQGVWYDKTGKEMFYVNNGQLINKD